MTDFRLRWLDKEMAEDHKKFKPLRLFPWIILTIGIIFLGLMIVSVAHGYEYESQIDPKEFLSWKPIESFYTQHSLIIMVKNPDRTQLVKIALLKVSPLFKVLVSYAYLLEGKLKVYILENGNYIEDQPSDEIVRELTDYLLKCSSLKEI